MKKITFLALFTMIVATPAFAAEYSLDKSHTHVGFSVSHMMVSSTKGEFKEFDGKIFYDPKNPESARAEATIIVASIDTDNQKRDNHLRDSDFFDAEKFPEIKFKSKSVKKKGDKLLVTADLTIKDVTKEITFPVEVRGPVKNPFAEGKTKIGMSTEFTIDRRDFNIRWSKSMEAGGLVVGNEVTISLDIEADSI